MKKSEIRVGGLYLAKVGGAVTTVRVDAIRQVTGYRREPLITRSPETTCYDPILAYGVELEDGPVLRRPTMKAGQAAGETFELDTAGNWLVLS